MYKDTIKQAGERGARGVQPPPLPLKIIV